MEYTISYKKIRHGYARLSTDGKLNLTIPTFLKNDENFKKSLISKWSKLLSRYHKRTHIQAHTLDNIILFWENIPLSDIAYKTPKQLDTYLKETLYEYIKPIVDKYSELIWNNYEQIKIRKLKSKRWSCAHDNTLLFNLDLVHLSTKYIRYVVIHEVSHIKHKNHSSRFRDLVAQYCPDYKLLRKELKNFIIK